MECWWSGNTVGLRKSGKQGTAISKWWETPQGDFAANSSISLGEGRTCKKHLKTLYIAFSANVMGKWGHKI